eukprot:CAMPEP_0194345882 /NCGR_PEP_ID=MMETSP0171-20130528/105108_1 /TAXON_ID=218684 /ORGANISM="Corethron pennatum, Strain L29A3" /LENGTH=226 /DNA_ID=CAMNT_0039112925 /DNA_START=373 /DNA_END=1054 /DNA_ORIENTATION=-
MSNRGKLPMPPSQIILFCRSRPRQSLLTPVPQKRDDHEQQGKAADAPPVRLVHPPQRRKRFEHESQRPQHRQRPQQSHRQRGRWQLPRLVDTHVHVQPRGTVRKLHDGHLGVLNDHQIAERPVPAPPHELRVVDPAEGSSDGLSPPAVVPAVPIHVHPYHQVDVGGGHVHVSHHGLEDSHLASPDAEHVLADEPGGRHQGLPLTLLRVGGGDEARDAHDLVVELDH